MESYAPPRPGVDIVCLERGSIATFSPMTEKACTWMFKNLETDFSWSGDSACKNEDAHRIIFEAQSFGLIVCLM